MSKIGRELLGHEIRGLRTKRRWTLQKLGDHLSSIDPEVATSPSHLSQVERGDTWPSGRLVDALDQAFETKPRLIALLRQAKVPSAPPSDSIHVRAHLFQPTYIGHHDGMKPDIHETHTNFHASAPILIHEITPTQQIYVFPFGTVVLHEVHELAKIRLHDIAQWRRQTINDSIISRRCERLVASELGIETLLEFDKHYVLTAFELCSSWPQPNAEHMAMQLLSMPSLLLSRHQDAPDKSSAIGIVEEQILSQGFRNTEVVHFGMDGISIGCASWAGVSYHILDPSRAVGFESIATFEIELQALWCYASYVSEYKKPHTEEYGAEYLKQAVRNLARPSPTEHTQNRLLREAIVSTSRIEHVVADAIELLN